MSGKEFVEAAQNGKLDRVRELLAQRADVESRNPARMNNTALMETASNGRTDIFQALLAAGANVNAANEKGITALHMAGWNGYTEMAQALLAAGANPEAKDNLAGGRGERGEDER
eukprot:g69873.t1